MADAEEQKLRQKCHELKKRIIEIESSNEIATLALSRTKAAIRRQRLEYAVLLERLEDRAIHIPNGPGGFEEMASPPVPSILDESLSASTTKAAKGLIKKNTKKKTATPLPSSSNGSVGKPVKSRDPDLPKRPTNAYLIFCEMEKERVRQETGETNDVGLSDLSRALTEAWKNLSEEGRKPYYKLYEDERLRYQVEMSEYNKRSDVGTPSEDEHGAKRMKVIDTMTPEPGMNDHDDSEFSMIRSEPPEEEEM